MMFDLMNRLAIKRAISPVSIADNTAAVSQILDMQGQMAACLVIATGSIADADATFTVLLEESDASNMAGATAVADADLIGTEALAGFQFEDDNECRKLGYKGSSRYSRATITPANNASAALLSAVWLTTPQDQPAANPPA